MEHAQYVSKVGKQINDSTKYKAKLDRVSITNITLIDHLQKVYDWLSEVIYTPATVEEIFEYDFTEEDLVKIKGYINCLKKEMNFYPERLIDDDCILTEVEEHIIQE